MNTELLLKYIAGDCTDQEKVTITNWLDSEPENMREFLSLRKLHDITIWQTSPSVKIAQKPIRKIQNWSGKHIYIQVMKIAAVFLVAIFVSRFLFPESKPENSVAMQTIHVPAGQRAEITLVDGTKVWLNAKTTFIFPNSFSGSSRNVTIDGEGFFDVSSNKLKPFVIKTEKYNVKVLGTKFNLMAYSGKGIFETSLLEGSVEVLKSGGSKGILIKPNERIFLENGQLVLTSITHMNHFLWKEGIISFNDESFLEMVKKLELYFDLKIEVKNEKILKYRCTGKFRTKDGVEHILKVLQLSNKFSYNIDEKLNMITIK
jgi:ferric-dicitrate binding protein FerR (iron transport regulator)